MARDIPNFIWISIICHVLLGLIFYYFSYHSNSSIVIPQEKSYYYYVPAYSMTMNHTTTSDRLAKSIDKTYDLSQIKQFSSYQNWHQKSDALHQLSQQAIITQPQQKYQDAIHLVGEEFLDDPLRKLLGKAITAHIFYPDMARELYMRGVVSIELVLHPDGTITNARIIKSSRERILDRAALRAINTSSPINGVDLYVKKPRRLIVNIIF